ncbi:MAG: prolipoprotein diacylglyceryl transferase [Candidatus Methylomirabilales bacterium]
MLTAAAVLSWDPDPILVRLGPLAIRWYGLFFVAAFFAGYLIMMWIYRREGRDVEALDTGLMYMLGGTIVGARLGHVLLYEPGYYLTHPLEILKVWEGGLASHGAAAGILIALYLYVRRTPGVGYLWLLDRVGIVTALGGCFIRIGNFFNSEIVGTPTPGGWGVVFVRVDALPRHPVQLYEALAYLVSFAILLWAYLQYAKDRRDGLLLGLFFVLVFSARFALEFVKTPQAAYEGGFPLTVGQLLSIPLVLAGIVLMARARPAPGPRR